MSGRFTASRAKPPAAYGRSRPRHAGPPRQWRRDDPPWLPRQRSGPSAVWPGEVYLPEPRSAAPEELRRAPVRPIEPPSTPGLVAAPGLPPPPVPSVPPSLSTGRPRRSVSRWCLAAVGVAVGVGSVLGFVNPGFLVTRRLDQTVVQEQVRTALHRDYQLSDVGPVTCPANLKAVPGRSFVCVAAVGDRQVRVPVLVQDRKGHLRVGQTS
jgi:hypothetical protein